MTFDPWSARREFSLITMATSWETPASTYGPFTVDHYGLAWIVDGGGVTSFDNSPIVTRPGTVVLMRPGMSLRHDWGPKRSFQSFIVFDFEEPPSGWPPVSEWPRSRDLEAESPFFALWRTLLAAHHGAGGGGAVTVLGAELLVRMFLTGATETAANTAPGLPDAVERALAAIQRHADESPAEPLRLTSLARIAGVSQHHLCRLFRAHMDATPMECASLLRLERAASRLERTENTLQEIAAEFGYSSQFHLSRAFKAAYGMPPSEYRRAFRAGFASRPGGLMYRRHRLRRFLYESAPGRVFVNH